MHHSPELKIKLISLGFEAKTIRRIEQRMFKTARRLGNLHGKATSLYLHRLGLRPSMRNTHLAYGFLKDKPYKVMEQKRYSDPNWDEILRMATQYGVEDRRVIAQRFAEWKASAGSIDVKPSGAVQS